MANTSRYLTVEVPAPQGLYTRRSMPNLKSPIKAEYSCKTCRTRIANKESILSWDYRGSKGKAALFTQANVTLDDRPSVLLMDSGVYRIQHTRCAACSIAIGWKFLRASEKSERWKEGYFVLELALLDEERAPLSPLEEVQREYDFGGPHAYTACRLSVMGLPGHGWGHRRTSSDSASEASSASSVESSPVSLGSESSPRRRARPLGPRQLTSSFEH